MHFYHWFKICIRKELKLNYSFKKKKKLKLLSIYLRFLLCKFTYKYAMKSVCKVCKWFSIQNLTDCLRTHKFTRFTLFTSLLRGYMNTLIILFESFTKSSAYWGIADGNLMSLVKFQSKINYLFLILSLFIQLFS